MPKIMIEVIDGRSYTVQDAKIISLPRLDMESGSITALNSGRDIIFEIRRIYYLYDVPNRSDRGAHAHRELFQLIIAATGSFEVELDDSIEKRSFILRQPDEGLLIPPGLWRDLTKFSGGAVCLVLADKYYNESDYIRDKQEFNNFKVFK
jgi:hypothetical protein